MQWVRSLDWVLLQEGLDKVSKWERLSCHRQTQLFPSVYVEDDKMDGHRAQFPWFLLSKNTWFFSTTTSIRIEPTFPKLWRQSQRHNSARRPDLLAHVICHIDRFIRCFGFVDERFQSSTFSQGRLGARWNLHARAYSLYGEHLPGAHSSLDGSGSCARPRLRTSMECRSESAVVVRALRVSHSRADADAIAYLVLGWFNLWNYCGSVSNFFQVVLLFNSRSIAPWSILQFFGRVVRWQDGVRPSLRPLMFFSWSFVHQLWTVSHSVNWWTSSTKETWPERVRSARSSTAFFENLIVCLVLKQVKRRLWVYGCCWLCRWAVSTQRVAV